MSKMLPKEFIQTILIDEIGEIHESHPYIAFAIMAIGIEFLGKCLNSSKSWNASNSKVDFESAINELEAFSSYRPYLKSHTLWNSLRNGFAHSFVPKNTITLSSKDEADHFHKNSETQINLKCENFYVDFKKGCEEVINKKTFRNKKKPILEVPTKTETASATSVIGTTIVNPTPTTGESGQISIPPLRIIQSSGSTH
jgi:hypothetical protein